MIFVWVEEEIFEFDDEDKLEFLEVIGLIEFGVDKLIWVVYYFLGFGIYFIVGEKEVCVWIFKCGIKVL